MKCLRYLVNVAWNTVFELSTLDLAYVSDCMHERTCKTWWDTVILNQSYEHMLSLNRPSRQRIMYWVICQGISAHCYHNSERGPSHCILKQVDRLHSTGKKNFVGL